MSLGDMFRQLSLLVGLPAVLLAGAAAATIVIVRDWRLALLGYAVLSVMLALLLSQVLPTEWALQQALVGGLNAVMLFLSATQLRGARRTTIPWEARWPQMASLSGFRLLAVTFGFAIFTLLREQVQLPQVTPLFRDAIVWVVGVGLLGLALHEEPLHAGLSLLTVLGGFSLLYFSLVQRRMLLGLAGGGQLVLGLAIAYLVLSRGLATSDARGRL